MFYSGSSDKFRVWDVNNFSKVVEFIYKKFKIKPIICGGIGEIELSGKLIKSNKNIKYISLVNQTDILELINVIARAEFVLTNDSAASHISSSVNTSY